MEVTDQSTTDPCLQQIPVVGVGASAGGLDSFRKFIKAIPEKSGSAYLFIQHFPSSKESALPELLRKVALIPVMELAGSTTIKADTIYVIPPSKILTTSKGNLALSLRGSVSTNGILDLFFSSLAVARGSLAVGVVLSGTGTDGTLGLKKIKKTVVLHSPRIPILQHSEACRSMR